MSRNTRITMLDEKEGTILFTRSPRPAEMVHDIKTLVPLTLDLQGDVEYHTWAELLQDTARTYKVADHIDDPRATSSAHLTATKTKWKQVDEIVLSWIYGTISQDLLLTVVQAGSTARDAWLCLKNLFHDNTSARAAADLENPLINGNPMLMDKLKKLIHGNHHPLINNHPLILSERPQFQLLYQELHSIIQTLSYIHHHCHHRYQHHALKRVKNLKKIFKDVVEEADDIIDLYLSAVTVDFINEEPSPRSDVSETSLDLKNVMRSIEPIKVELMSINIDNMKMDSSPRISSLKTHPSVAATATSSSTRRPLEMKPFMEETVVGLDRHVELIWDKLVEDTKELSFVSVVGMGGVGKTTLATKIFNHHSIKHHFHIRAWATVSQTYIRQDFFIQILTSMGVTKDLNVSEYKLGQKLHKNLMDRRYLIVIDDIWSIEALDDLTFFLPHGKKRSRILLTSRLYEVALHVKSHGFIHSLPCLTVEESWELLKQKVFHGDECPEWLIEPGRQIARKCQGLPLSVVVMAGVLAGESMNEDLWENIACNVSSYIVSDQKGCLDTLALSYHHLPYHLRECFLYLGGFPEDSVIHVEGLIWLWVAEGFVKEVEDQSLNDTAKAYLMDLLNRNLVIVAKRNVIGEVKACKLHDLVRELCLQKAKEERFFHKIDSPSLSSQLRLSIPYQQRRVFTSEDINIVDFTRFPTQTIRSVLCFYDRRTYRIKSIPCSFVLLRVLDLRKCGLHDIPQGLALLVHLRYLAIAIRYLSEFPESICRLWSLETLILQTDSHDSLRLPHNITDLVNLRHLWSSKRLYLPYKIGKPMNLLTISTVMLRDGMDSFHKCFPIVKKLEVHNISHMAYDFKLLPYLEKLKLSGWRFQLHQISAPATLKKLTLEGCLPPWSDMSIIQLLPNLEVLKVINDVLTEGRWDACEQQFRQLKLLTVKKSTITHWKASGTSFPCLKRLTLLSCSYLEEIPLEIGEIDSLELIEIDHCSNKSLVKSLERIQEVGEDVGNDELKITVDGMELSFYLSQIEGSESEREYNEGSESERKYNEGPKSELEYGDGSESELEYDDGLESEWEYDDGTESELVPSYPLM